MPKIRTNRAAAKRFSVTKNGNIKRMKAGARHLKTAKSPKRVRNLRAATLLSDAEKNRINKLLPYS